MVSVRDALGRRIVYYVASLQGSGRQAEPGLKPLPVRWDPSKAHTHCPRLAIPVTDPTLPATVTTLFKETKYINKALVSHPSTGVYKPMKYTNPFGL